MADEAKLKTMRNVLNGVTNLRGGREEGDAETVIGLYLTLHVTLGRCLYVGFISCISPIPHL